MCFLHKPLTVTCGWYLMNSGDVRGLRGFVLFYCHEINTIEIRHSWHEFRLNLMNLSALQTETDWNSEDRLCEARCVYWHSLKQNKTSVFAFWCVDSMWKHKQANYTNLYFAASASKAQFKCSALLSITKHHIHCRSSAGLMQNFGWVRNPFIVYSGYSACRVCSGTDVFLWFNISNSLPSCGKNLIQAGLRFLEDRGTEIYCPDYKCKNKWKRSKSKLIPFSTFKI